MLVMDPQGAHDSKAVAAAYVPRTVHAVKLVRNQAPESRMLILDWKPLALGRYATAKLPHRKILDRRKKGLGGSIRRYE